MGDLYFFRNFFRISGIQAFLGSVPPPRDRNPTSSLKKYCAKLQVVAVPVTACN